MLVHHRINMTPRRDVRSSHDEWHSYGTLIHVLLSHQSLLAHSQAMICRHNNVGVIRLPRFVQRIEHAPHLPVHVRDVRVIFLAVDPHNFRCARKRGQVFVPPLQRRCQTDALAGNSAAL